MSKTKHLILTFIISFTGSYLLVGFYRGLQMRIDWVGNHTIWDILNEYYIRSAADNIILSLALTLLVVSILLSINKIKRKHN